MSTPTITIIGSLNTDLVTRTTRLPSGGETLLSTSFSTGCGGKGANQAVACSRLSRPNVSSPLPITIRMIGAVGSDPFGTGLLSGLESNGVEVSGVKVKEGEKSGVAVIIVEEESGENRILMSPNANFSLQADEFRELPAPLPDLIVLQLEIPLPTVLQNLKVAKERGVEVLLNPAPAQKLPKEAWEAVTHLIVNESEAAVTTGCKPGCDWFDWGKHTEEIIALGVPHVIVTLGDAGVLYIDSKARLVSYFPAHKVRVVDTTAAGDTFVGAYAVAVTKLGRERGRNGVAAAVKWANGCAAKAVQKEGAQEAVPWGREVEVFEAKVPNDEAAKHWGEWKRWKGEMLWGSLNKR